MGLSRKKTCPTQCDPSAYQLSGSRACCFAFTARGEGVSNAEHDDFGDGDALDEQEGAIGAKNPQRAFDFAPQSNGNLLVTILMS